jgi:hypothetical protein
MDREPAAVTDPRQELLDWIDETERGIQAHSPTLLLLLRAVRAEVERHKRYWCPECRTDVFPCPALLRWREALGVEIA